MTAVVVTTGGACGIGRPIALRLLGYGRPVAVLDRDDDACAALATWLLGPEAGFVTGQQLVADGGMTRRMIYAD